MLKNYLIVVTLVLFAGAVAVAGGLVISVDHSRPLYAYEGPPTNRRDPRGRPIQSTILRAVRNDTFRASAGAAPSPSGGLDSNRDGRAQHIFKPIVVTSRPFGFANNNNNNNLIRETTIKTSSSSTTSTTTTTTESPYFDGKTPVTIPFFSISCTAGSPCSQIVQGIQINVNSALSNNSNPLTLFLFCFPYWYTPNVSARPTKTAKPTFKPYTREDIDNNKSILSLLYLPSSKATSTPRPTSNVLRIRTTTARPVSYSASPNVSPTTRPATLRTTTAAPSQMPPPSVNISANRFSLNKWMWPSSTTEQPIDRNEVKLQTWTLAQSNPTTEKPAFVENRVKLYTWTPRLNATTKPASTTTAAPVQVKTTSKPNSNYQGTWLSLLSATLNGLQKSKNPNTPNLNAPLPPPPPPLRQSKPQTVQFYSTAGQSAAAAASVESKPQLQVQPQTGQVYLNVNNVYRPEEEAKADAVSFSSNAEWSDEQNLLVFADSAEETRPAANAGQITVKLPAVVNHHEIISTKGNKISLITAVKRPAVQVTTSTQPPTIRQLPAEVSISSHVIGLKIKPKSLRLPSQVKTDGRHADFSRFIAKEELPPAAAAAAAASRPARLFYRYDQRQPVAAYYSSQ